MQCQKMSTFCHSSASASIIHYYQRWRRAFATGAIDGSTADAFQRAVEHNPHLDPEATFDKLLSSSLVHWEQWAGLVARGRPESLVLIRLQPPSTTVRAPGPGAIPKVEWKPIADKWLKDRHVILHTDSARSYKAKVPGVLHDSVVHQKNPAKVKGKWVWKLPNFAKLKTHKLPSGKTIRVKAGTQIIHRAWRFIKDRPRWVAPSSVLISDLRSMSTGIAVKICGHAPGSFCLPTCKTSLLRCSNLLWPWGKCAARLCLTIAVFLSHLQ